MDFTTVKDDFGGGQLHGGPFALRPAMVLESLLSYSRMKLFASDGPIERAPITALSDSLSGRLGDVDVYGEEAFQHFLDVERTRARRLERPLLLLLVTLRKCPEKGSAVPASVSSSLMQGLGLCVREVDFIGWYRTGQVVGAVLAQGLDLPNLEASSRIVGRVHSTLAERVPRRIGDRLRVRLVKHGLKRNF
jgi:hypothetical protein